MKSKQIIKRVGIISLAIVLSFPLSIKADYLIDQRESYSADLKWVQNRIENLKEEQQKVVGEINSTNQDIIDIQVQLAQTKMSIEKKEKNIEKMKEKIKENKKELKKAQKKKDQQYKAMRKRIQYFYQNGRSTHLLVYMFSNNENFSQFLNKKEYINNLEDYDRKMLLDFIQTVKTIEKLEKELLEKKKKLVEEKNKLELEKIGLEENQKQLEIKIKELKEKEIGLEGDIQEEVRAAAALAYEIAEIDREIAEREAEEQRIREQQRMLRIVDQQQPQSTPAASFDSSEEQQDQEDSYQPIEQEQEEYTQPQEYYEQEEEDYDYYEEEQEQDYTPSTSNYDITSYAQQFLGNPYVWGGNSLTEGCDCSHFVYNVLKDTGHYNGGYTTSNNWAYLGERVPSLDSAVAGDVVVYSGHVAIYDGNGYIIEAKGSQYGITYDRSVNCKTIVAIRRFN